MTVERSNWDVLCWPPRSLPHPDPPATYEWELCPGGAFVLRDLVAASAATAEALDMPSAPVFDETYLRLAAVDPSDDLQVAAFVEQFSIIDLYEPHATLSIVGEVVARPPYPLLSTYPGFDGMDEFDLVPELVSEGQQARAEVADLDAIENRTHTPPATLPEMRWAVRCMRDLVAGYRCLSEGREATDFQWENPLIAYDVDEQRQGSKRIFWTPSEIAEFVVGTIQIGLAGFSPRIAYRADLRPEAPRDWAEHFGASAALWSVCCLELFNHVTEGAVVKDCANETCPRLFVRQIGRSLHGQRRRSGVRFCSDTCARAQAQREYVRRRRSARKATQQ